MELQRNLNEFIAGLTWPLRGRRVTMRMEKQIREDMSRETRQLNSDRMRADDLLSNEIASLSRADESLGNEIASLRRADESLSNEIVVIRNEVAAIRQNIARQLDDFRQALERSLMASEKITRGNFSFLLDKIAKLEMAGEELAQSLPEQEQRTVDAPVKCGESDGCRSAGTSLE